MDFTVEQNNTNILYSKSTIHVLKMSTKWNTVRCLHVVFAFWKRIPNF